MRNYSIKYQVRLLKIIAFLFSLQIIGQNDSLDFIDLKHSKDWELVFEDDCTYDWTKQWALDGLIATVENSKRGMYFKAGPEYKNDAHHAVLWTNESFNGDIKIEYDYTRTDSATKCVNILYIQATGDEEGIYKKDISKWKKQREVPAMRTYFENMNLFHISYSAFGNNDNSFHYVRARRYPKPDNEPFKVTQIEPSYDKQGFFKTGQTYHITAIKTNEHLFFKMESKDGIELFKWDISNVSPITEGRVGLRQMYTRSSLYKNFKIYSK
ncbi:DUF1961 family protein [Hyunsoonleella flava]|uniref:DUF1961 family protein n=1 Tax=Hyunsoonleella flava TaxID=2527939 RepID=A0A4V2JA05_9FLAO|nr:DUF1961 family protein [Hyunsoonleella flava]TBN02971.1 DUF1961 family protein [Hyunsoonleella flava]